MKQMSKIFKTLLAKECPMCGRETYMRMTSAESKEWSNYVCYGGLIQEKLPSLDKFAREFIKTGYCPACQEKLFSSMNSDTFRFFSYDEINLDTIYEFNKSTESLNAVDSILSKAADKLTVNEKVLYLCEMGLEDLFYVDEKGTLIRE